MNGKPWFKFYGSDWLSDPKRDELTAAEQNCVTTLFCYANVTNQRGKVPHLTEDKLMIKAGLIPNTPEWEATKGIVAKLASPNFQVIKLKDGLIIVKNWNKRQEATAESTERVRRWREKRYGNATETLPSNGKSRVDKNREEDNKEHAEIVKVIDSFKEINPAFSKWYGNKTQRKAISRLIKQFSLEKVLEVVKILPNTNLMDYSPRIYTPDQLENKWAALGTAIYKSQNREASKQGVKIGSV
jgi:hypothetical protein